MITAVLESRGNRVKRLAVSAELLLDLLKIKGGTCEIDGRKIRFDRDPIPDTAKALRCWIGELGVIEILIEDQSFDDVPEGGLVPRLVPVYSETVE